jgi:hypothetical protein
VKTSIAAMVKATSLSEMTAPLHKQEDTTPQGLTKEAGN